MQTAINQAHEWGTSKGLSFSPEKTVVVMFSHRRKPTAGLPKLVLNSTPLDYEREARCLGIILDDKLTYRSHNIAKCKKATRLLMAAKQAMGKLWGPSPKKIRWMYETMIRPIIMYGAIVWAHRAKYYLKYLNRVQRLGMLCLGTFARSTPTLGLEVIFNYLPLDLRAELEAHKCAIRILHRNPPRWDYIGHKSRRGHLFYYNTRTLPLDKIATVYQWDNLPIADIANGEPVTTDGIVCYTDGSKTEDHPVGYGYIILNGEELVSNGNIGSDGTVFQGEIMAIHQAARRMQLIDSEADIHFFIDNQAAIQALTIPECTSASVLGCRTELNKLSHNRSITLHWVKSHVGHKYNEKADKLAKAGAGSNRYIPVPLTPKGLKSKLKQKVYHKWKDRWTQEKSCRQTKQMVPQYNQVLTSYLFVQNRVNLSLVTQFITGHNYLRYHLKVSGQTDNDECRMCLEEVEDSWHLLTSCEALVTPRFEHFLETDINILPHPRNMLNFIRRTKIVHLMEPGEDFHP